MLYKNSVLYFTEELETNIMNEFNIYRSVIIKLDSCFAGLPSESASLIKSLITIAIPNTGLVTGLIYFAVDV